MYNRSGVAVLPDIHGRKGQNTILRVDNRKCRQAGLDIPKTHRGLEERRSHTANDHAEEDILHTPQADLLDTRKAGEDSDVYSRHIALDEALVSPNHVSVAGCGGRQQLLGQQRLAHVYVYDRHCPKLDRSPADQGIGKWKETWGLRTVTTGKTSIG